MLKSPCIQICRLDADHVCIGCGRHAAEIARWSRAGPAEQAVILARAAQRRASRTPADGEPSGEQGTPS